VNEKIDRRRIVKATDRETPGAGRNADLRTVSSRHLLVDGGDRKFRDLLHALLTYGHQLHDALSAFAEFMGVTSPQYELLINIRYLGEGDGVNVTRLAAAVHCSGAFVTTEIGKLVAAGLVGKRRDANDRRCVLIDLTRKCRARFDELAALQRPVNDALFACLSGADFKRLTRLAPQLVECGDRGRELARFLVSRSRGTIEAA
jgi:DNA-binding MarR family transcriptional regulator